MRNELGALLIERRRFADAEVELKRAVADKPDLAEAWFNLGQAAAMQKDCATALAAYARATRLSPTDADGFINQSVAARKCGRLPEATAAARQAVKLAAALRAGPPQPRHRARGVQQARRRRQGVRAWRRASSPTTRPPGGASGSSSGKLGKRDAAIAALDRARTLSPTAARIADLGVAWRDKGDLAKATSLFREALAKDPRYTPARWHLAQMLSAQHQCGELKKELAALPPAEARPEAAQKLRAGL